jgi:hypothetical protein
MYVSLFFSITISLSRRQKQNKTDLQNVKKKGRVKMLKVGNEIKVPVMSTLIIVVVFNQHVLPFSPVIRYLPEFTGPAIALSMFIIHFCHCESVQVFYL